MDYKLWCTLITVGLSLVTAVSAQSVMLDAVAEIDSSIFKLAEKKPFKQESKTQYNLLYHGGGLGPFVTHMGYGISPEVPEGYIVDQVHLLARHGERFPSRGDGTAQKRMIDKLQNLDIKENKGDLAFLKDYEYFAQDDDFEQLSSTGTYSGAQDALIQGREFQRTYGHLYHKNDTFPVFAASDKRVVDTAKYFSKGFLGDTYHDKGAVQVIPEIKAQGANTLAPSTFCSTYDRSENNHLIDEFPKDYLAAAAARLEKSSPGYKGQLTNDYVFLMMTMCVFELNTKGKSRFCPLFTKDEWLHYAYNRDLIFYYQASFGHEKSLGIGSNYLNATMSLLKSEGPIANSQIFASFTHDTDMTPVLVPLGLFDDGLKLPTDEIFFDSLFKSSQIVPMGARFVIERLKAQDEDRVEKYIRIKVGNSVIPLPGCTQGPGFTCEINDFMKRIEKNLDGTTYLSTCKTDPGLPQHLSFYWDWKETDYTII